MKSIFKLTFVSLLCISIFFCFTTLVMAETDEAYTEARTLIGSINPVDDCFNADEILTRGEFISAVVKLMNYGYVSDAALSFTDVEQGEKLYDVLSLAISEGLVSNSVSFRPNDAITYAEAITIAVRALGYEGLAKELGTYPSSYLSLSTQLDLDENVSTGSIMEKDAYILMLNMLEAKALSAGYVFANENYTVNSDEQKTLLESIYGIYVIEGIMTANAYTVEGDEFDTGEPERIMVGSAELKGTGYDSYIGMNVKAYYTNDKHQNAVCIYPYDTEALTLDAFSIDEISRNGKALDYHTNDDKTHRTETAFEVIYNGKYIYSYSDSDLIPVSGSVTLIDNNSNGRYDVIKIDSYDYIYDARVNRADESIFDNTDSSKAIHTTDSDVKVSIFFFPSKAEAHLSDIKDGNSLAVRKSKDGLLCEVYILSAEIEGAVTSYNSGDKLIEIAGSEYKVSNAFASKYNTSNLFKGYMTFKTGINGEIIEVSDTTEKFRYGYLLKTRYEAFKDEGAAKIFTDSGKMTEFPIGAKITIDGRTIDAEHIKTELSDYQIVRYLVNTDGVLTKIDTATEGTEFIEPKSRDDEDSLTSYESFGTNFYYRANIQTFYPHFSVGNAVIFAIPDDVEAYDDYYIAQPIDFTYKKYNVTGYDISSNGKAGAVLYSYKNSDELSTAEKTDPVIVVEKAFKAINKDGEETTLLRGWDGKNFVEYYLDPKAKIDKASGINELYPGDVIRYSLRGDEMKALIVEFDAHPGTFGKNNVSGVSSFNQGPSGFQYQSGKVYSKADGYMYLANVMGDDGYDYSMKNLKLFNTTGATVLVIDCENGNSVRPGTVDDIMTYTESGEECDFVVLKQESVYTYHIIIYKGVEK